MAPSDQERRQLEGLWLAGRKPLANVVEAAQFMQSVGFALRYNATPSLPLAAMYKAAGDTRRAIELTNALLASGDVVESNVIADRLVLIQRGIVPAVLAARRQKRPVKLSPFAERVFQMIRAEGHATSGEVRRFLGVAGQKRPDPGDLALAELQRDMLIDRGPSSVPRKGIPYLSPEGFPYRVFDKAHAALVKDASRIKAADAACSIIETYLRAAVFVTPRKLSSMFRLLFDDSEISVALDRLEAEKKLSRTARTVLLAG